jgi:6-phosphogluconolactonase/glucosamine-6-phosphate isomerase/deaminase
MEKSINDLGLDFLDIVILSLGEDGHLAGSFKNSTPLNEKITFTNNAPKLPKKRISFSIDWLIRSKLVIIVALGNEKQRAIQNLISGAGTFSSINLSSKNIVLLRD